MKQAARHVLIVGAGIFGAVAALALRKRGWRVTVMDPGPLPHPDASSTDVSKVIRMDYGSDLFYLALGEASLEGWDRWNRDWERPLYHQDGFLILSKGTMDEGSFEAESFKALTSRGHAPQRFSEVSTGLTSQWDPTYHTDGYYNPRAGWAESGEVVRQLVGLAAQEGVDFLTAGMADFLWERSAVSGVRTTDGRQIAADRVVVAAGAWTPSLLPWLSEVIWPTGQPVLHFQVDDPTEFSGSRFSPWAADISGSGWYGFPALPDGRVKVANHGLGTRLHPDDRGVVTEAHIERTRAFLRESIPALADRPVVHSRVCMYCDSFDGDFLIGADPDREGLIVATGGSGHGFKFAPVLGDVIADAVEGVDNPCEVRFGWRDRGALKSEEARFMGG
jgi:sarcosine oxidase